MTEPRDLVLLTKAQRMLAQASTVDEVKQLRDKAAAVRAYAQKARLGRHLVVEASVVRIRAERRLGEMLKETQLACSVPGNQHTGPNDQRRPDTVLLADLGISKNESSRSQRIAELPAASFEQYLAQCVETEREPTFAGLRRLLRPGSPNSGKHDTRRPTNAALDSNSLLSIPEGEYSTILAVPPWPGGGEAGHSPLTTDRLCALRVAKRCREQAHLYVWTDSRFLLDGFDVMDAWGFTYQTSFVVVYENADQNAPWGDAHHFLLAGVRGALPFHEWSGGSWLVSQRPANGSLPDEIPKVIEAASPGPYLLLFGSQDPLSADWTLCPSNPTA